MTSYTPARQYPYSDSSDPLRDGYADIRELALALDEDMESVAGSIRGRADDVAGGRQTILGSAFNQIATDALSATILGGGQANKENVIGRGLVANVNTALSNVPANLDDLLTPAGDPYSPPNYSVVAGYDNVAAGLASIILSFHSYTHHSATHGGILSGSIHRILAGDYNVIAGGNNNQHTAGNRSAIVGGGNNVSNGSQNTLGGYGNTVTTNNGTAFGINNEVTADGGVALGNQGRCYAIVGMTTGLRAKARTYGQRAHAADYFTVHGDAQHSDLHLKRETVDAVAVSVGAKGATDSHTLEEGQAVAFEITGIAKSGAEWRGYHIKGTAARNGAGNVVIGSTPAPVVTDLGGSAGSTGWSVSVAGVTTALAWRVTGAGTIRWSGRMDLVEVI